MYSPKIREDLIPKIYRAAKSTKVAMTKWVDMAIEKALPPDAEETDPETKKRTFTKEEGVMTETELEQRKARAATETLVIAATDGGFRVYNPANITHLYMVSGIPELPQCNCPDFDTHKNDSDWRCKHILAVLNRNEKAQSPKPATETAQLNENASKPNESVKKKKGKTTRNGHQSQMLIKRSISPDGHIDSVSVEFSALVDGDEDETILQRAKKMLLLQAEIANGFLQINGSGRSKPPDTDNANGNGEASENGHGNSNGDARNQSQQAANGANGSSDNAVPAQMLNIAGMETRGGWKTFINIQVNGITTKLFGEKQELAKHITDAGFVNIADRITQGMLLNLPCRVTRQWSRDGKYLNIVKVLPAQPLERNGRAGQ